MHIIHQIDTDAQRTEGLSYTHRSLSLILFTRSPYTSTCISCSSSPIALPDAFYLLAEECFRRFQEIVSAVIETLHKVHDGFKQKNADSQFLRSCSYNVIHAFTNVLCTTAFKRNKVVCLLKTPTMKMMVYRYLYNFHFNFVPLLSMVSLLVNRRLIFFLDTVLTDPSFCSKCRTALWCSTVRGLSVWLR